jgi:hypothetical protein
MNMKYPGSLCMLGSLILLNNIAVADDVPTKAANAIIADNKDAIVRVLAVMKKSNAGGIMAMLGNQPSKINVTGTVLDPSGLTVISSTAFRSPLAAIRVSMADGGDGDSRPAKPDVTDVKIQMPDGTEFPARLVLEDPDLGLTFLMPEKKDGQKLPKFSCITGKHAAKPELLDSVIMLGRLGESLDHQPIVSFAHISAIVRKPRTFFSINPMNLGLNCPVFAADQSVLGLCAWLPEKDDAEGGRSGMSMNPSLVVIPMEDVMDLARQALKKAEKDAKPAAK